MMRRVSSFLLWIGSAVSAVSGVEVGTGPTFNYRNSPREAMAADPNAAYTNTFYSRESPSRLNCSYFSPRGTTNLSSGTVTYVFETPPGFLVEHTAFAQKGTLFAPGSVSGDYSTDGGPWRRFFSVAPYPGSPFSYERQANFRGVYATNITLRYTLVLTNGFNYNVQLWRDCDDATTAFVANGTIMSRAEAARRIALVPARATWRYLDTGANLGSSWRLRGFDDSAWPVAVAEFGYGDGDEATLIRFGPNAANKFVTTYFRHAFEVTNATALDGLSLGLLVDDGAVVYLNGFEVYRANLSGAVGYQTYADLALIEPEEMSFREIELDPETLVEGTNVIAVEVHQATAGSSDLSFDLDLRGVLSQPQLYARHESGCVTLSWFASGFVLEEAPNLGGPWIEVPDAPVQTYTSCGPARRGFYRLRYNP